MRLALLLASVFLPCNQQPATIRVDLIERNHVISPETGLETVDQVIYWRWHAETSGHRVIHWRFAAARQSVLVRTEAGWRESYRDGSVRRVIYSRRAVETWTTHDPEVADRDILAQSDRVGWGPN